MAFFAVSKQVVWSLRSSVLSILTCPRPARRPPSGAEVDFSKIFVGCLQCCSNRRGAGAVLFCVPWQPRLASSAASVLVGGNLCAGCTGLLASHVACTSGGSFEQERFVLFDPGEQARPWTAIPSCTSFSGLKPANPKCKALANKAGRASPRQSRGTPGTQPLTLRTLAGKELPMEVDPAGHGSLGALRMQC